MGSCGPTTRVVVLTGVTLLWALLSFGVAADEQRGLFIVMRAGCSVCDVYTPRLKALAARGVPVRVAALDNLPLKDWPDALPDKGQARQLGVVGVPTTFLFEGKHITNLGAGLIPTATLMRRLGIGASRGTQRIGQ